MKKESHDQDGMYRIVFPMIRLMHDNAVLRLLIDPLQLLRELGVREGQSVLEVGCGPGFYTVGAARAVGPMGRVFAYEVNPYACAYVKRKLAAAAIGNVVVANENAARGLPEGTVDFAFVTGVPHVAGGISNLLAEIRRVLKPGGILAYRPSRGDAGVLVQSVEKLGLVRRGALKRFLVFSR